MTDPLLLAPGLRYHEMAAARRRILNPISADQLMLVGERCRLRPGMRLLDLACGKGELLSRFAERYGVVGVGVDLSPRFLAAARDRAVELGVSDRITLVEGDAAAYLKSTVDGAFDVVSCLGGTGIGGDVVGTVEAMRSVVRPGGLLLVGEVYWSEPPPAEACEALGIDADAYTSLAGMLDLFESAGVDLVEMVLSDTAASDEYHTSHWMTVSDWLRDHPDHQGAMTVSEIVGRTRRSYLAHGRRYQGWGVFVLRPRP